ncbi:hypothetical protein DH2020_027572 [Rehmannia glutinosa]|uniref:NAC domain-containing protein n=1 Tax=Rehmannia glutinosa TaxID=99300 RepID=A0ABR0VUS0_REHGL
MNSFTHVPPGFRFHPTDEELVDYYLRKKIASKRIDLDVIKEIDLYKIEPWDLQELCRIGTEEQSDWYFFSHKDKKYPTGTRTNRATKAGFWKATGRDKAIYTKHSLVGMRKTLEEGWVVCRVFKKKMASTTRRESEHESLCNWYDEQVSFMPDFDPPNKYTSSPFPSYQYNNYTCKQELEMQYNNMPNDTFLQLPNLESPKVQQSAMVPYGLQEEHMQENDRNRLYENDQVTDWRVLDKFVASQLSQDDGSNTNEASVKVSDQSMSQDVAETYSDVDLHFPS